MKYQSFRKESCEKCGVLNANIPIEVHHGDGNRKNNDPKNLVTLCPNCNSLADRNGKKRGRPRSGIVKTFWCKRVTAEQRALLEGAINGEDWKKFLVRPEPSVNQMQVVSGITIEVSKPNPTNESVNIKALMDNTQLKNAKEYGKAMADEVTRLQALLDVALNNVTYYQTLDLDEKGKLGWRKFYAITKAKGNFDQTLD